MSKTNALENAWQALLFNGTAIADIADNDATSPLTSLYFSLHATWPGEAGSQTTGEVGYTDYARAGVSRSSGALTVTGNAVSPAGQIAFPMCGATGATANFVGIGKSSSGAGTLLHCFPIGSAPTVCIGLASDTFTSIGHGLIVDDPVVVLPLIGNTLPGNVVEGTIYYVKTAPDADTFTLSATVGGATFNVSSSGAGMVQKLTPYVIATGATPAMATTTTFYED